jgi:hypothetical protein
MAFSISPRFVEPRGFVHDLQASAKEISENRYSDLQKEYQAIFPGLDRLTNAFMNGGASWVGSDLTNLIGNVFIAIDLLPAEAQQFKILGSPEFGIQALYSVGFIGIKDEMSGRYRFCHDGSQAKLEATEKSNYLVHPCYWRALNVGAADLTQEAAEEIPTPMLEIRDEYDIEVSSKTPEIRKHRIGQIMAGLANIPMGDEGAAAFEQWCHQTLSIVFVAGLTNVELKPNGDATQRRDIVARNNGSTEVWRRALESYGSRQVLFEIKNYAELGPKEYRQMLSYLCNDYGKLGFIITRDKDESLRRDKELPWCKEMYYSHGILIVKLTATWLCKYLSKARNPQKHDAADIALGGLLDRYSRNYLSLGGKR